MAFSAGERKRGFFRRYWWVFALAPVIVLAGVAGTFAYVYAHTKLPDLNTTSVESAMRTIEGTARNMGLEVVD